MLLGLHIKQIKETLRRQDRTMSKISDDIERLATSLQDLKRRYKEDLKRSKEDLDQTMQQVTSITKEREDLSSQLESANTERQKAKDDLTAREEELTRARSDLENKDREASELRTEIETKEQRIKELEEESGSTADEDAIGELIEDVEGFDPTKGEGGGQEPPTAPGPLPPIEGENPDEGSGPGGGGLPPGTPGEGGDDFSPAPPSSGEGTIDEDGADHNSDGFEDGDVSGDRPEVVKEAGGPINVPSPDEAVDLPRSAGERVALDPHTERTPQTPEEWKAQQRRKS